MVVIAPKKAPGLQPDSKKALLLLDDGSSVSLNEMNNGFVVQQGNVTVNKKRNGELEYVISGKADKNSSKYNTLQTPRGSQYKVVLNDGTRIWLNAASTLRFPIHFNHAARKVQLTGEAFFEVAKMVTANPITSGRDEEIAGRIPFIVGVGNMEVQAIGTVFNISAYKEDNNTQTTVVEGLVKVSREHKDHLLSPGKKLVASDTSVTIEEADVKTETAWKTGDFVFHNSSLQIVMNELARWYDMEVVYEHPIPSLHFTGEIPRGSAVDKVLEMLEYTGGVHFTVNNRVIKVISHK
jgi:transmembrane sensor